MKSGIGALAALVSLSLVVLTLLLMLLISVQIVMRYLIGKSIPWSLEVSQILFIWIVFLGAALAVHKKQFATMELLAKRLPRWWSGRLVFVLITAFAIAFGWLALHYLGQTAQQRLTMTDIPSTIIYLAPVVASSLMVVFGLRIVLSAEPENAKLLTDLQAD
jgi:TRAP-type C4-dicarboxylate transport system permease small subunit